MTRTFIGVAIRNYIHQSSQKRQIDDDQKSKERVLSPGNIWKAP
ncbi:hypothetical protein N665_0006s0086 [Sinapis alba]|nr:hypothetical protein N665_0006s0086 [Sinapis alba]